MLGGKRPFMGVARDHCGRRTKITMMVCLEGNKTALTVSGDSDSRGNLLSPKDLLGHDG